MHLAERRATLVLAFNLIRKRGALPNSPLRRRYIEDTALRRPAPDNVPVAENRRPSTVLQEWTCPSQGKSFLRAFFRFVLFCMLRAFADSCGRSFGESINRL